MPCLLPFAILPGDHSVMISLLLCNVCCRRDTSLRVCRDALDLRIWRVQMRWACRPNRHSHIIVHCMPLNVGEVIWSEYPGSGACINCNELLVGLGLYEGGFCYYAAEYSGAVKTDSSSGIRQIIPSVIWILVCREVHTPMLISWDWFWFCWIDVIHKLCCGLAKRAT